MTDWPRLILMIFYAPLRGMREVRDRGALFPAIVCAYISQVLYAFVIQWLVGNTSPFTHPQVIAGNLFQAATSLLPIVIVLVPLLALTSNLFDRRGSFGLVLQQEYASLGSVIFYALIAANLVAILISIFFHFSGVQATYVANSMQSAEQIKSMFRLPAEVQRQLEIELKDPAFIASSLFRTVKIGIFSIGAIESVKRELRLNEGDPPIRDFLREPALTYGTGVIGANSGHSAINRSRTGIHDARLNAAISHRHGDARARVATKYYWR